MKLSRVINHRSARHGILARVALVVLLLLPSACVRAQATDPVQPAHRTATHYKRPSLDDQVEVLAKYLDLDDDQRSSLKNILLQRQQEIQQMRLAASTAKSSPNDRFRAIEDRTVERIRATLNEEQRKKYEPIGVRRLTPSSQQPNVEDWLKATGPREADSKKD
jgi:hypothetical protein